MLELIIFRFSYGDQNNNNNNNNDNDDDDDDDDDDDNVDDSHLDGAVYVNFYFEAQKGKNIEVKQIYLFKVPYSRVMHC